MAVICYRDDNKRENGGKMKIRNEELSRLAAEVLPERAVLGVIRPVLHIGGHVGGVHLQCKVSPPAIETGPPGALLGTVTGAVNSVHCAPAPLPKPQ
jgi:hypothetical protein